MANLNIVGISGRLTRDPELRTTTSGKQVTSFTLAVNAYKEEDTSFIEVVAWQKTAEIVANYTRKGDLLTVSGRLQQRKYEDKSGNNRSVIEVIAQDVQLPPKGEQRDVAPEDIPNNEVDLSSLPF